MNARTRELPKVIVLVGPTASGKSEWALRLAKKFNGEIISADSRQVYKKMDIGTAKARGEWMWRANWKGLRRTYYIEDVPHHLMDFLDPGQRFTVAEFRDRAIKYIKLAQKNERVPIVAGGTGLYVSALVNNLHIPRVSPNTKLRSSLEKKSNKELLHLLANMDPVAATTVDIHNKRRLIRALEVCILTGEPFSQQRQKGEEMFTFLQIGIDVPKDVLHERIHTRIDKMIERGLVQEIEVLLKQKYSWRLPSMSGIGYRQFRHYFDGNKTLEDVVAALKRDTRRYSRRQLTWFRRDERIHWHGTYDDVEKKVAVFLRPGMV
jgi:tRNA dimethylallyltransferase